MDRDGDSLVAGDQKFEELYKVLSTNEIAGLFKCNPQSTALLMKILTPKFFLIS